MYDTQLEITDNLNQSVEELAMLGLYVDTLVVDERFGLNASSMCWFRLRDDTGIGCGLRGVLGGRRESWMRDGPGRTGAKDGKGRPACMGE